MQQADIALDPFPFNGHTTTCDAIWMGVPVVMLEGDVYASRFGGSVLANVGLEKLIARSVEEYVERAVQLAGDLARLSDLRGELRSANGSPVPWPTTRASRETWSGSIGGCGSTGAGADSSQSGVAPAEASGSS